MKHFGLKIGYSDTETKTLALHAILTHEIALDYFRKASDIPKEVIPVGTIEWVTSALGYTPLPDSYPSFLQSMLYRKVWRAERWPLEKNIFIKPFDKPKRFSARITTGTYKGKKKGPFWCSEVVKFVDEWRFYIVNGFVTYSAWYRGEHEDKEPPPLYLSEVPVGWHGTLDFGELETGEIALVEAHEPYAVGWYGGLGTGKIYAEFLIEGWKYLLEKYGNRVTWGESK